MDKKDIPTANLLAGAKGVILVVYEIPNLPQAYEVEFLDNKGGTLALLTLTEDDIETFEISDI